MRFGVCYIPDYHPEYSGSGSDCYEGMIVGVGLAETLGFEVNYGAPRHDRVIARRRTTRSCRRCVCSRGG